MGVMPFYGGLMVTFIFLSPPVLYMQKGGGRIKATAALDLTLLNFNFLYADGQAVR